MKMKWLMTGVLILMGVVAQAAFIPSYYYTTDVSTVLSPSTINHIQASSAYYNWRFENTPGVPYDLTGAISVTLNYGAADGAWGQTVTGSVVSATNGSVRFLFTPANTATNGYLTFDIRVSDGTDELCRSYGDLDLRRRAGSLTWTPFPYGTNVNLASYTFINYPWLLPSGNLLGTWQGYSPTNFVLGETDPVYEASPAFNLTTELLGLIGSALQAELDPEFTASPAAQLTTEQLGLIDSALQTNAFTTYVSNGLAVIDCGSLTGFVFRFTTSEGVTNVYLP